MNLIKEAFDEYINRVWSHLDPKQDAEQIRDLQCTFYAGAIRVWALLIIKANSISEDEAVKQLHKLNDEIIAFLKSMKNDTKTV